MVRKIIFYCVAFTALLSGGCQNRKLSGPPELVSINIIDRNGLSEIVNSPDRLKQYQCVDFLKSQPYQKVVRVYGKDAEGNSLSYITSYYPNGQPKQYLEVLNNRAFGCYQEWFQNGVLSLQTRVIGGIADLHSSAENSWLFDGLSMAWDENGNLSAEILYCKGDLEGVSKYYHSNGMIWKLTPFSKNKLEGTSEIYTTTGELLQSVEYSRGVKNGSSLRFWPGGGVAAEEFYAEGILTEGRYFNLCGELVAKIEQGEGYRATFTKTGISELQEYHCGVLEGEVKVYDKNTNLVKIYHVKRGLKHGEEIEFMETSPLQKNRRPRLLISWYEGKIQGMMKTWYPNGTMESQREMSNNSKNGLLTAWYLDGNLMLIEEYDRDKLIRGEYYRKGESVPISQVADKKGVATLFDSEGNFLRRINIYNGHPQN